MAGVDYALNGVALDSQYCRVTLGSTLFAGVSVSRSKVSAPFRHGTIPSGFAPSFEERSVTLKVTAFRAGALGRADAAGLDSSRLARLCTAPSLTLARRVNGQAQQAVVELASLEADDGGTVLDRLTPFTAVFAMPQVWWRDPNAYDRQVAANTTDWLWPSAVQWRQEYWTRWSGTANDSPSLLIPLSSGIPDGMFGDAPVTDPIIRLPKGVSSASVTDPTSNTGVIWQGAANANAYTYVDVGNCLAWQSTADHQWTQAGTDVTGGLDYPAGGLLQCWPNPVDNGYRLTSKLTGSAEPLLVHARRAWW
ncbi:hypothetical protein [Bifidobacterium longum]|uniref:Uncharacterized protein n=1 Tax=Bifidobacterium longum subsp. longum TaxID=1679 RepID=A0A9Q8QS69_BIFLL|nr:hypothetical protein [Bifidobacterium longum]UNL65064.1 hypothetical protein G8B15_03450 [Bifidobacterium longum subsp. longum]UNL66714.1 hypothetical protein G8B14_01350 [Bifidobacterium longum subsp. longum]UNL68858.1 hypothetical protein G8B13_02150 [Bifidobacterium longum subsp. longum]UNL72144.1 hypothetical protein G8B12_09945 [Bifidobacterium longum subsp. longum]UNL81356.1 hypothetical protein G8B11_02785 [Bifidobacterium longum subsp. longum]